MYPESNPGRHARVVVLCFSIPTYSVCFCPCGELNSFLGPREMYQKGFHKLVCGQRGPSVGQGHCVDLHRCLGVRRHNDGGRVLSFCLLPSSRPWRLLRSEGLPSPSAAPSQTELRLVRGREADGGACLCLARRPLWTKLLGMLGANTAHSCPLL